MFKAKHTSRRAGEPQKGKPPPVLEAPNGGQIEPPMNIRSNAYYEIPLENPGEYVQAEVEHCTRAGECYCHVSMHCHHPEPCHFCKAEVEREFIAWCEEDDRNEAADEVPADMQLTIISPLDIVEIEEWLRESAQ